MGFLAANRKDRAWVVFNEERHGLCCQRSQIAYYKTLFEFLGTPSSLRRCPAG